MSKPINYTLRFESEQLAKNCSTHFPVKSSHVGYCILLTKLTNQEAGIYSSIIQLVTALYKCNIQVQKF